VQNPPQGRLASRHANADNARPKEGVAKDGMTEMRLDAYLARTRLVMPRGAAKRACDNGIVSVNRQQAKPATSVGVGDQIEIRFTDQDLVVSVVALPGKSVRKADAPTHYRVVEDRRYP